ncbi:MAG: MFS transporter [Crenarchaeota archaeon]|nr:MFS transporter [Thermoproteota archaeon]
MEKRNIVGLGAFQFMLAVRRGLFYAFLTLYMLEVLKRSFTEAMLVMTLPMLANSITQSIIWGPRTDYMGKRKPFIIVGETVAGIFFILLTPHAWSVFTGYDVTDNPTLYAYYLIVGLTILESIWSMSNVAWSALLADLTVKETRGLVVGQIYSIEAIGRMFGVFFGGVIYDYPTRAAGFPYLFYMSSAIMFVSVLVIALAVRETRRVEPTRRNPVGESADFAAKNVLYAFMLAMSMSTLAFASIFRILNYYLRIALSASSLEMSMLSNVSSMTQFAMNPIIGRISDKKGRVPVLRVGFLLGVILPILYIIPRQIIWFIPVSILMGMHRVIFMNVSYSYVADIIPESARGKYLGRYNMIETLSFGVLPILTSGILLDALKSFYSSVGYSGIEVEIFAIACLFLVSSIISLAGFVVFELHRRVLKTKPIFSAYK